MRVRKIAKQLKRWYNEASLDDFNDEPIYGYRIGCHDDKIRYVIRMTKNHYFKIAKKYPPDSLMCKLYIHKTCSPYIYDDFLSFWCINV